MDSADRYFIAFVVSIVVWIGVIIIATDTHEDEFGTAFQDAMKAETAGEFLNATEELKEYSNDDISRGIEDIQYDLESERITLSEGKGNLALLVTGDDDPTRTYTSWEGAVLLGVATFGLNRLLLELYK